MSDIERWIAKAQGILGEGFAVYVMGGRNRDSSNTLVCKVEFEHMPPVFHYRDAVAVVEFQFDPRKTVKEALWKIKGQVEGTIALKEEDVEKAKSVLPIFEQALGRMREGAKIDREIFPYAFYCPCCQEIGMYGKSPPAPGDEIYSRDYVGVDGEHPVPGRKIACTACGAETDVRIFFSRVEER